MRRTFPVYPETETSDLIRVVGVFLLSLEDISIVRIISLSFLASRDDAKVFVLFVFVFVFVSCACKGTTEKDPVV